MTIQTHIMAKKKKQPDASKKSTQKKKQQIIEDKTFGLKNKNKSKKVQQQIRAVERNVMNSGDSRLRRQEEARQKAKADAKARKKAQKEEQDALFGAALLAVQKKTTKHANQKDGKVEAKGRDADDNDANNNKKSTSRAMKMMFQMDAQEMEERLKEDPNYVPTLEDKVEAERQQKVQELQRTGKKGTPVTPETFAAWKERKQKKKLEESKKKVEAEFKKKKGGKGLSVLSGRDLYEYKKDLFEKVEDDDDDDDDDDRSATAETNGGSVASTNGITKLTGKAASASQVDQVAARVQSDLFLEGDDDDLDDLVDDEE